MVAFVGVRPSTPGRARRGTLVAAAVLAVLGAAPAHAAKLPTYTSPGFKGSTKAPPTRPPVPPTPVSLADAGTFPSMVVDEAGTAHIVWNDGRGDQADAAVYCRLPRGATSCQTRTELIPVKDYGAGDGPEFNIDNGGPKIVRVGDQLVVLSYRYPTVFTRPDEPGSGAVVQWTSVDGGSTWSGGQVAARHDLNGGALAFGPSDAPRLLTINHTGPCGVCVQQIKPGTYDPAQGPLGAGIPDANYDGALTLDGGVPTAVLADLARRSYVRRWTGTDPITDPNTWGAPVTVPGDEPSIAGGAGGLWVMTKPVFGGPFVARPVTGATTGAPLTLSRGRDDAFGVLGQDPLGRLMAAWESRSGPASAPPGVRMRTVTSGVPGAERYLVAGNAAGQLALGAAKDGGGVLVANQTGGVNSPGKIVATAFGTRQPTGVPGLGGLLGPATPGVTQTCERIRFGAVNISTDSGSCFLRGTGQYSAVSVTEGEIDLNGLRVIPDPGSKIVIDPKEKKLYSTGGARVVLVQGTLVITLWHGVVRIDMPSAGTGQLLASFDTSKFGVDVLGFGISGRVDVILTSDGVRIPIALKLPPYLGDIRGEAELVAQSGKGLKLDSLHIHVGNLLLGPLLIDYFDLRYTNTGEVWEGEARMHFPPPGAGGALDAKVRFDMGAFKSGSVGYEPPPPGIVIGPAIYLTRVGGTFELDPTHLGVEARIGAGAAVNGVSPVSVDGHFDLTFPKNGPFTLTGKASVAIFVLTLANARFDYVSDGYASFQGDVSLPPIPVISMTGQANGFVDGRAGTFGATAKVQVCVDLSVGPAKFPCLTTDLALNKTGVAACITARLPDPTALPPFSSDAEVSGGLALDWAKLTPPVLANPALATAAIADAVRIPCHTSAYVSAPRPVARAAQAGAPVTVAVTGRPPSVTVALRGQGGAPDVDVSGPGGAALPKGSTIARSASGATTYVMLARPAAGTWTITPRAGSATIIDVRRSTGYTPATVRGSVGGRGRSRLVRYRVTNGGNGQVVRVLERGSFGTRTLGTARSGTGVLRFTTGDLRGGRRTVFAQVEHDGLATDTATLGSYVAPSPAAPGKVRGTRVRRRGTTATITWRPAAGATRYLVTVRGSHGLRRQVLTSTRRVVLRRLAPGDRITAKVRGLSRSGRRGPV